MSITAIYPGTFDPITHGHTDLVQRASRLFEKVIVAVAADTGKKPVFSIEQRLALAKQTLDDLPNIEITSFDGLLVNYAMQRNASVIIRGLRAVSDFEYEVQLAAMNRRLQWEVETLFLAPAEQFTFISSSLIRQIAALDGDVSQFVAPCVQQALQQQLADKK
jgi:pantetheine-phosphate adenylyltransferase